MRLFLIKIFSLSVLISSLLVGFEIALRKIPNNYSYKNQYLNDHADELELLIFGNSHAYRGINPESLNYQSFNLAYISQSLNLDEQIFNKYKYRFNNLKYLVVNVSYPSLFLNLNNSVEDWRLKNYAIYYDLPENIDVLSYFELYNSGHKKAKNRLLDYYVDNISLKTCDKLGFEPLSISRDLKETGRKAAIRHTNLRENKTFLENKQILEEFAQFCEYKNVKLIVVTLPVTKYYRETIDTVQLSKMIVLIDSMQQKNSHVYYFNQFASPSFSENDFLDGDHLNKIGAKKYTTLFDNYLKSIQD